MSSAMGTQIEMQKGMVMETTFPGLLLSHAAKRPLAAAMREKEYGIWQALSWADLATMVEQLACGLHEAGLRKGEHMVVVGEIGRAHV